MRYSSAEPVTDSAPMALTVFPAVMSVDPVGGNPFRARVMPTFPMAGDPHPGAAAADPIAADPHMF